MQWANAADRLVCLTATETRTDTDGPQSNTSPVWIVIPLLALGITLATVGALLCWCCCWQRRRPLPCCDVMVRTDVTSGPGTAHDLLHSLVAPPLRKRILFMRNNILYASGTAPPAKVSSAVCRCLVIS